ncbi:MAG: threonine--tRNA ligase [Lentisphaeria bacterium]
MSIRHSAAHIMAAAVQNLYKEVKFDIGPATDDGFYYDFDMDKRLSDEDLKEIEKEMKEIIFKKRYPFERLVMGREEAAKMLAESGQVYKLERLADIPEGEEISFYRCGDFMDLCRGPHVEFTNQVPAFKLLSVAGSYFKGKEGNPMLQRIYGTAFSSKEDLASYLKMIEEAKKRDHRKIGKEMDLFSIDETVGAGLVLWHPKGARIRSTIENFWRDEHFARGYEVVYTPHIGLSNLWETSGHLDFYREGMYANMKVDERDYYAKPMNCPFHVKIFQATPHSYRDLPCRLAELGTVYRYEKSGTMHGLFRVRGFTQDDAHIICTPEQVENEVRDLIRFSQFIWKTFGFTDVKAYLATQPAKAVGEKDRWDLAINSLKLAVEKEGLDCEVDEGGGAFYGPKIDLKVKDALGREWQTSTIQFDFNLPERFDMSYVGEDGQKHRPFMLHRALLGSFERFFGILIEHFEGKFPLWIAPEQVRILPITDKNIEYCNELEEKLRKVGIRCSVNTRGDKIGAQIRNGRNDRLPYMLVVGDQEAENNCASVFRRGTGDIGSMSVESIIEMLVKEVEEKSF